jgi:hypothetical protein
LLSPHLLPPFPAVPKEADLQGFPVEPTGIEPVTSCLQSDMADGGECPSLLGFARDSDVPLAEPSWV